MALTKHQVNLLVGYLIADFHHNGWPIPPGLAPYSGTVGKVKRKMIARWQPSVGLKVTGEFDTATQKKLTPVDPRAHKAAAVMAYCAWAVNHHGRFYYSQARPVANPAPSNLYGLPRYRDCSAFAADAAHVGGFPSIMGTKFEAGYGNTDTLLERLQRRPIASLRQADLVVFSNPGHVIVVTGPHATDPAGARWAASNGHQGAPEYVTLQREIDSHHGSYYGLAVD